MTTLTLNFHDFLGFIYSQNCTRVLFILKWYLVSILQFNICFLFFFILIKKHDVAKKGWLWNKNMHNKKQNKNLNKFFLKILALDCDTE